MAAVVANNPVQGNNAVFATLILFSLAVAHVGLAIIRLDLKSASALSNTKTSEIMTDRPNPEGRST